MSLRNLSRFCGRRGCVVSFLKVESGKPPQVAVTSAVNSLQFRFVHSSTMNQGRVFSIEGVQGPIPDPLTVAEANKLLNGAAKHVRAGVSQQGVQGCHIHTHSTDQGTGGPKASVPKTQWDFIEAAAPQGIQGCADQSSDCGYFSTWLENCQHYGLANCDQQLQGIQSGRLTLAQVLAEQQAMITEIAENYRKRTMQLPNIPDESMQGAQGRMDLPDISIPCPQGVQGDDCVRFKLWLENCHRFGMPECSEHYEGFQSGRMTLAQLFSQQEAMIRQVVQEHQRSQTPSSQKRAYSTQAGGGGQDSTSTSASSTAQVGGTAGHPSDSPPVQLSQRERLKRAVKEYGSTVIVFHITISLVSLGGFYLAVSSGIDLVGILKSLGVGETILQNKLATGTGTFVVAYAVHKVFAPVRIAITLTSTPFIVRYLRSKGILKPPKTKKTM